MSTERWAKGEITITPELNHREVRRFKEWNAAASLDRFRRDERDVTLDIWTATDDTDQGVVHTDSAARIIPRDEGSTWSRGWTESDLRELVEMYPGHVFTGFIEVESEGHGDDHEHFRLYVRDHTVVRVDAEILWTEP